MTILSKEALEKIKKERAERNEDQPAEDVDALFRELDVKIQEEKEEHKEESETNFDDLLHGDFDDFESDKD